MNPAGVASIRWTIDSEDGMLPTLPSMPQRCWRVRSKAAALVMDSQYVILPVVGMTMTRPGSADEIEAGTSDPSGRNFAFPFWPFGRLKTKVSGEDADTS